MTINVSKTALSKVLSYFLPLKLTKFYPKRYDEK